MCCISWVLFGSFLRSVRPVPFPSVPDGPVSVCFSRALLVSPPLLSYLSELAFRWGLGGVIGTRQEDEMHFLLYQNCHKGQINTVNLSKHARLMCFRKIRVWKWTLFWSKFLNIFKLLLLASACPRENQTKRAVLRLRLIYPRFLWSHKNISLFLFLSCFRILPHPASARLKSTCNHDNHIQQSRSGRQGFLLASLVLPASPAPGHQRWTLFAPTLFVPFWLQALVLTWRLAPGPAGPVGTIARSTLEMGPISLLCLLPVPLASLCLLVVLIGPPKRRPGCQGPWRAPAGACGVREAH